MSSYIRVSSAAAAVLMLAACAAGTADVKPSADASATVAQQHPACPSQTASRIAGNGAHCSAFGRSYSNEDIERTGATTAGEALRLLDPALTVHH